MWSVRSTFYFLFAGVVFLWILFIIQYDPHQAENTIAFSDRVFLESKSKTELRLAKERDEINVVSDQLGTPTNAADLAQAILTILPKLNNEAVELFHYSNAGACSWYDFAKAIFQMKGVTIKVNHELKVHNIQQPPNVLFTRS